MNDMVIVSICAGNRDVLINPELVDLAPIAPPTHAFTVFTTGMPTVWTSMDHQAIVWCKQVARKLVSALIASLDVSRPERTLTREKRLAALESVLQSPLLRAKPPKRNLASVVEKAFPKAHRLSETQASLSVSTPENLVLTLDHRTTMTLVFFTDMKLDTELNVYLAQRLYSSFCPNRGGSILEIDDLPCFLIIKNSAADDEAFAGASGDKIRVNRINALATTLPYGYLRGSKDTEFVTHLALDTSQLQSYDAVVLEVKATSRKFLSFDFVDPNRSFQMISNSLTGSHVLVLPPPLGSF